MTNAARYIFSSFPASNFDMSSPPETSQNVDHPARSPSRPLPIGSPHLHLRDDVGRIPTPLGTPVSRSWIGTPPLDIPPRNAGLSTPPLPGSSTPGRATPLIRRGSATPSLNPAMLDELSDSEKAKVLRRHLVSREQRGLAPSESAPSSRPETSLGGPLIPSHPDDSETFPIPYDIPGGDVTHDIYKWQAGRDLGRARSASFSGRPPERHPAFEHIREPGGFRRNYLLLRADDNDLEDGTVSHGNRRILATFIDFLYIFGHFVSLVRRELSMRFISYIGRGRSSRRGRRR